MEVKDIEQLLRVILDNLPDKKFPWWVGGSAGLKIQGLDVSVHDLDITTNNAGIKVFRKALKEFIIKDFYSQKIKGLSLICDINSFKVEINSYGDRSKKVFDKRENVLWRNLSVPVLPLQYVKEFYKSIGRDQRAALIEQYLSKE